MKILRITIAVLSLFVFGMAFAQDNKGSCTGCCGAVAQDNSAPQMEAPTIYACPKCHVASLKAGKCACGEEMMKINAMITCSCDACKAMQKGEPCPQCKAGATSMIVTYMCPDCKTTADHERNCPQCKKAMTAMHMHSMPEQMYACPHCHMMNSTGGKCTTCNRWMEKVDPEVVCGCETCGNKAMHKGSCKMCKEGKMAFVSYTCENCGKESAMQGTCCGKKMAAVALHADPVVMYVCEKCRVASTEGGSCHGQRKTRIIARIGCGCPACHMKAHVEGCIAAGTVKAITYACEKCHTTSVKPGKCKCGAEMKKMELPIKS